MAVVSYSINISVAKLFSRKYKYTFKPNYEAFAYGIGNIILSLFLGVPSTAGLNNYPNEKSIRIRANFFLILGLSRCAILESLGTKTLV